MGVMWEWGEWEWGYPVCCNLVVYALYQLYMGDSFLACL